MGGRRRLHALTICVAPSRTAMAWGWCCSCKTSSATAPSSGLAPATRWTEISTDRRRSAHVRISSPDCIDQDSSRCLLLGTDDASANSVHLQGKTTRCRIPRRSVAMVSARRPWTRRIRRTSPLSTAKHATGFPMGAVTVVMNATGSHVAQSRATLVATRKRAQK